MKRTILSIATVLMTSYAAQAQFSYLPSTDAATGLTFTGNTLPTAGTNGQFYQNQAYKDPMFSNSTCTVDASEDLGGFDAVLHSTSDGITSYGGAIATVYFDEPWATCAAHIPSLGFNTSTGTDGLNDGYNIDLSNPANQVIQFTYTSDVAWTLELQLFDGAYNAKLNSTPISIQVGTHTETINFSSKITTDNASVSTVRQVSFLYNSTDLSPDFAFSITNIKLGSALVTGLNNSTSVANANLYPNPSTGTTTISGELKSVSDVKITLVDMLGQEVKVIAEERTSSINTTFDVANLKKGIYSVVTNIDGAPAKSQMLVVR